jgi:hypothetical protein
MDTASISALRRHLNASLLPFDRLGTTALAPYQDLFEGGVGDKYFRKDLLSPIAREVLNQRDGLNQDQRTLLYGQLIRYYRAKGNREGALLWTLDSIKKSPRSYEELGENPRYSRLCQVADEFRDLSLNAQTYLQFLDFSYLQQNDLRDSMIMKKAAEGVSLYRRSAEAKVLKQYLAEMRLPTVFVEGVPRMLYPDEKVDFVVIGENLKRTELRLYRLKLNAIEYDEKHESIETWKKFRQGKAVVHPIHTPPFLPTNLCMIR